jgi:Glycosyl hydrolase family 47
MNSFSYSYFIAETLRYLYLLFDESEAGTDPYPLEQWVVHPLPVFSWTEWEREWYGIVRG